MQTKITASLQVREGVTEDQINAAIKAVLALIKVPGTIETVYVGGSDDQPPQKPPQP